MPLVIYKYRQHNWLESTQLMVRDVALIVDDEHRAIYLWEGEKATTKQRVDAHNVLGKKKLELPDYTIAYGRGLPEGVRAFIQGKLIDENLNRQQVQRDRSLLDLCGRAATLGAILLVFTNIARLVLLLLERGDDLLPSNLRGEYFASLADGYYAFAAVTGALQFLSFFCMAVAGSLAGLKKDKFHIRLGWIASAGMLSLGLLNTTFFIVLTQPVMLGVTLMFPFAAFLQAMIALIALDFLFMSVAVAGLILETDPQ
jgi:hypothetical protein